MTDPHANFKAEVAAYTAQDPMPTIYRLSELTGISAAGGYIWSGDYDYGNIDVFQYGAPNSATVTYRAVVRRKPALSMPKNPHTFSTPFGKHPAQ